MNKAISAICIVLVMFAFAAPQVQAQGEEELTVTAIDAGTTPYYNDSNGQRKDVKTGDKIPTGTVILGGGVTLRSASGSSVSILAGARVVLPLPVIAPGSVRRTMTQKTTLNQDKTTVKTPRKVTTRTVNPANTKGPQRTPSKPTISRRNVR